MEETNQLNKKKYTVDGRLIYDFGQPYVPERDYKSVDYTPMGELAEHFCTRCKNYYCDLYKSKITSKEFPPRCEGDISQNVKDMLDRGLIDDADVEYYLIKDPISFAAGEFNWGPRFYQRDMLRCSSQKKVIRAGRRVGKSVAMAVKILHLLYTNKAFNILLVCPYQSQVKRVFDIMRNDLIANSISFSESIERDLTTAPHIIQLANKSTVSGFSSGAKSGGKSTQIRGQDAHAIFFDEMDYLSEDDFEAVLAILTSHPDCILWASSTPTGLRSQFFDWCTIKDLGFKEFHYISAESPSWRKDTEEFLKERYSEAGFLREFLAEFGDEAAGVFKNSDINKSLEDYDFHILEPNSTFTYMMGVDWNETSGVHIVINQLSGGPSGIRYKLVYKEIVEKQQFTQHMAVSRIIHLDRIWNCRGIYVDEGFGNTQIEMLKKFGMENPHTKLHKKVKGYAMQSKVEIADPTTGEKIKKDAKPFMVGVAARQVEMGRCVLPKSEDTSVNMQEEAETSSGAVIGLVQQMRAYKVEKYSKFGMPTYSQGFDHTLTAWMLSLVGFFLEMSDINSVSNNLTVHIIKQPGSYTEEEKRMGINPELLAKQTKDAKKKYLPHQRGMYESTIYKIWPSRSVKEVLTRDKNIRDINKKDDNRLPFVKVPRKIGRKTF